MNEKDQIEALKQVSENPNILKSKSLLALLAELPSYQSKFVGASCKAAFTEWFTKREPEFIRVNLIH